MLTNLTIAIETQFLQKSTESPQCQFYSVRQRVDITIIIISLWVALMAPLSADAQYHHGFSRITIDQGLSQNSVSCIIEDIDGFLWFGTNDGLNKYDGYSLTVYRSDFRDSSSISHNWIQSLYKDNHNDLWIGTRGGLNKFIRETDSFEKYIDVTDKRNFIATNDIQSIIEDPNNDNIMWLGTLNGLKKFNKKTKAFSSYRPSDQSSDSTAINKDKVYSLCRDKNKRLWIGTGSGLFEFETHTEKFIKIDRNVIQAITTDHIGNLWIGTESSGLLRLDPSGNLLTLRHDNTNPNSLAHNNVLSIIEGQAGSIWIGTYSGGLDKFEVKSGHFTNHQSDPNVLHTLSNNEVRSLYMDKSGNLWCGTWGGGVNKLSFNQEKFGLYTHEFDRQNFLRGNIFSILEDQTGDLWLGTGHNGLCHIDKQTNKISIFASQFGGQNQISGNFVILIYEDKQGTIWIGSTSGGLDKFDRKTQSFTNYRHDPHDQSSLSYNNIQTMLEDRDGRLWIGTFGGGLNELNKQTGTFTRYRHDETDEHSLSSDIIQYLHEDRAGDLWIATTAGLNKFDKISKQIIVYSNSQKWATNSSVDYIYCIFEDQNSEKFWLGTAGGLVLFDKTSKAFRSFDEKNGLSNNTVYGILSDDKNGLWLSTNKGLSRFNTVDETFRNYDKDDGLQSNEFNQGAFFKNQKGQMFFGGIHGLNIFHPDSIKDNLLKPPIVLTAFKIFNQDVPVVVNTLEELNLTYRDYAFSFEFAALDFTNPSKNKYAYKLEGFDADWNFTNADRRFAVYTNLNHGNYIFHVKASNNDGVWNDAGKAIKIYIAPPFWKTWWFMGLSVVLVIGAVYTLVAYRVKRMLEIERMRTKIAADLHDNIGTGLTEISILSEVGIQQTEAYLVNIREKFKKIGDTARVLGQNMSDIVWLINPRYDSIGDILIQIKKSYEDIFLSSGIVFRSPSIREWNEIHLSIENRKHFYLILKEAINNSLKHSHCRCIGLDLIQLPHEIEVHFNDDGIGFEVSEVAEGNGLNNMIHRSQLIGGSLKVISSHGHGTKIILFLPRSGKTGNHWFNKQILVTKFLLSAWKIY